MHIIDKLNNNKSTLFSLEILPPLKGKKINDIYNHLAELVEMKPSWINVTYHRSETIYRKQENGSLQRIEIRKRPGTVGICAAIMNHYKIEAVPHLICGGFNIRETEDALIDLNFLGIDNILVLRGDPPKNDKNFTPSTFGHSYAIDLVKQIKNLNNGIYVDPDIINGNKTNFCMGVAGYPEKHGEAPNMELDLLYTKAKVDAGASYILTQMFFDNQKFYDYRQKCLNLNINVPILPGLKPIYNKKQLVTLPKLFNIEIPFDLANEILKAKDDKSCEIIGTEWLIHQSKDLIKNKVAILHYYTLGKPDIIKNVLLKII